MTKMAVGNVTMSTEKSSTLPYTKGLTGVNLWINSITSDVLYGTLGLIALSVLLFRGTRLLCAHVRLLLTVALSSDKQNYWMHSGSFWSKLKRHLLVAPLVRKRHHKELQISSAINFGTLPSRLHTLFLSFYILSNILYCCILDYHNQSKASLLAEARGRTGHLAVMNIVSLFAFSARNNPLIPMLGIPFDTFNVFHRWVGRVVAIQSFAHTFFWGVNNYVVWGMEGLATRLYSDTFLICGLIASVSMVIIVIQSVSIIRHAAYETFLHLHQFLVVVILTAILLHCEKGKLPQRPITYFLIALLFFEHFLRLCRVVYRRRVAATVEALDGGACRVTFNVRGHWPKSPGRHLYVYLPTVSLWMSHPFSIAWTDSSWQQHNLSSHETNFLSDFTQDDLKPSPKNSRISCIIACRAGMTAALYRKAQQSPTRTINLKAFVEGPYGGHESMRSYGTVVLFAGGVGITNHLTHVRDLLGACGDGTCATRRVVLVWSVRSTEQLEWVQPWMDELLMMSNRGCEFKVLRYVTRARKEEAVQPAVDDTKNEAAMTPSAVTKATYQKPFCAGRPDVVHILNRQFKERVGAMCVGVCGPGALSDEVRAVSRNLMEAGNVDFWEEAFTW